MRCEAWCRAAHLEELSEALSSRAARYLSELRGVVPCGAEQLSDELSSRGAFRGATRYVPGEVSFPEARFTLFDLLSRYARQAYLHEAGFRI